MFLLLYTIMSSLFCVEIASATEAVVTYGIKRAKGTIKIDGVLDEPTWACDSAGQFRQKFPSDSIPMLGRTIVRALYDEHYLYISAVCYDSTGEDRIIQSLQRDFELNRSDNFAVVVDPIGNFQTGYVFSVSPLGVQSEGVLEFSGAFGSNAVWDNVWHCEATIHDGYWIAEMAIPFNSLRFKENQKSWAVNFTRRNLVVGEEGSWSPVPRNFSLLYLPFAGKLEWDEAPKPGMSLSIVPFATTSFNRVEKERLDISGNRIGSLSSYDTKPNAGLDVKYGLTSSLNLDVSINPDFSNAQVDQFVTNLDRFELFFPERRLFFLENSDLFSSFGFRKIRPFFSRRIGLNSRGSQIALPVGVRLTGSVDSTLRIGVMNVMQSQDTALGKAHQNYTVAAVQRNVGGLSNIAGILVNREGFGDKSDARDYSRVAGLDYNIRSDDGSLFGKIFYHRLFSPSQGDGKFATAGWLHYEDRSKMLEWNHEYIGENYSPDVGFVVRRNVVRLEPHAEYRWNPNGTIVNQSWVSINHDGYYNTDMKQLDHNSWINVNTVFTNLSQLDFSFHNTAVKLLTPFDPIQAKKDLLNSGWYNWLRANISYSSDFRTPFNLTVWGSAGGFYSGTNINGGVQLNYRIQPYGTIGVFAEHQKITLPGDFGTSYLTLIRCVLNLSLDRLLLITSNIQLATQTRRLEVNHRLQWRFLPMSDLFFVYTEQYDSSAMSVLSRGFVFRANYWFNL